MGGFGGVTAGYNWMVSPNVLVGVETDISAAGIDGSLGLSASIDTPMGGGGLNVFGPESTAGQPAVRHAVGTQRLQVGQAHLQSMETEQVRHRLVQLSLLPCQQVLPGRGFQPRGQPYNRGFTCGHGSRRTSRLCRQLHLDAARRPRGPRGRSG